MVVARTHGWLMEGRAGMESRGKSLGETSLLPWLLLDEKEPLLP